MELDDIQEGDEVLMKIELDEDYLDYENIDSPTHVDNENLIAKQYDFPLYFASKFDDPDDHVFYRVLGPNGPVDLAVGVDATDCDPATMFALCRQADVWGIEAVAEDETPFTNIR